MDCWETTCAYPCGAILKDSLSRHHEPRDGPQINLRVHLDECQMNKNHESSLSLQLFQSITQTAHRVDQWLVAVFINLGAQAADVDIDNVGQRIFVSTPDV